MGEGGIQLTIVTSPSTLCGHATHNEKKETAAKPLRRWIDIFRNHNLPPEWSVLKKLSAHVSDAPTMPAGK